LPAKFGVAGVRRALHGKENELMAHTDTPDAHRAAEAAKTPQQRKAEAEAAQKAADEAAKKAEQDAKDKAKK